MRNRAYGGILSRSFVHVQTEEALENAPALALIHKERSPIWGSFTLCTSSTGEDVKLIYGKRGNRQHLFSLYH